MGLKWAIQATPLTGCQSAGPRVIGKSCYYSMLEEQRERGVFLDIIPRRLV